MHSSIYIPIESFIPGRHDKFLQLIVRQFRCILGSRAHGFQLLDADHIEYVDDIIPPLEKTTVTKKLNQEIEIYARFLRNEASDLLGSEVSWEDVKSAIDPVKMKGIGSLIRAERFALLTEYRQISLVVVSAEYSFVSRQIVIEAKKRKIPVMNIEHGFVGGLCYASALDEGLPLTSPFVSDFVIVDNKLETEVRKSYVNDDCFEHIPVFLPLGIPIARNAVKQDKRKSRESRLSELKLGSDKKIVTLIPSWYEPHSPRDLFQGQFEEADFFDFIFESIRRYPRCEGLQIIIKLHPAFKVFGESSVSDYLIERKRHYGINNLVIYSDNLQNILGVSDYVICSAFSSVIWECFESNLPAAVRLTESYLHFSNVEKLGESNELFRNGLLQFLTKESDLHSFLDLYSKTEELEAWVGRKEAFCKKWDIRSVSEEEASLNIIHWIKENIPGLKKQMEKSPNQMLNKDGQNDDWKSFPVSLDVNATSGRSNNIAMLGDERPTSCLGQESHWKIGCISNNSEILDKILRVSVPERIKIVVEKNPRTAAAGLNNLLDKGCNLLLHQDIFLPSGFFENLQKAIGDLPDSWVVAGFFGKNEMGEKCGHLHDKRTPSAWRTNHTFPQKALCIDECAMIVNLEKGFRFDESYEGFDLYGTYACLRARELGTAWILDCLIEHHPTRSFGWTPSGYFFKAWQQLHHRFPNEPITSTVYTESSVNVFKNKCKGQTVWIIGNGPSINHIEREDIGEGIVIAMDQAIEKIPDLPNNVFSMQKDGGAWKTHSFDLPGFLDPTCDHAPNCGDRCGDMVRPKKGTALLVHKHESLYCFPDHQPRYIFDWKDLGLPHNESSFVCAIKIAQMMGCIKFKFVCVDAPSADDCRSDVRLQAQKPEQQWRLEKQGDLLPEYIKGLDYEWITPQPQRGARNKVIKINLGSGYRPQEGYTNIDNRAEVKPDLVCDVIEGLPFEDNTVDEVKAFDFLEHIPIGKTVGVIEEIYRVLKPGGLFQSITPSTDGRGAFQDPTHVSFWNLNSWLYYTDKLYRDLYGIKVDFEIVELKDTHLDADKNVIHTIAVLRKVNHANGNIEGDKPANAYYDPTAKITDVKNTLFPITKLHQKDLVSIVILTFNELKYTRECIESIFTHTKDPFELIVVDNGSTDGTVEYLEREVGGQRSDVRSQMSDVGGQGAEVRVTIIKNSENLGFAAGNNQGMAAARGNYILLMNNDIVVTPGWLERMVLCAERTPGIGIVGPMSNYVSGPQLVKDVPYNITDLDGLDDFATKFTDQHAGKTQRFLRVVGFCMLIKRDVINKIGGMDDSYGLGNFEDDDFSLRATLAGFESWIAEDCFIHHFGNRTFIGAKIDYRESLYKNWEIFKEKWGLQKDKPYGSYNVSQILEKGFIPEKHYFPLPNPPASTVYELPGIPESDEVIKPEIVFKRKYKPNMVSIIIPVTGHPRHLKKCVENVRKYTPEAHEIIFVDNGCNAVMLKWIKKTVKRKSNYRLIKAGKDIGLGKCFNMGMAASSGEYIILLSDHVIVADGWLIDGMLGCLNSADNTGIVGPMTNIKVAGTQYAADSGHVGIDQFENYAGAFRKRNRHRRISSHEIAGFCMLFRRSLVERIGPFDEDLEQGSELDDYCLRAALGGYYNLIAGDVFIYKYGSRSSFNSRKAFNEKWSGINARSSLGKKLLASKALEKADELNEKGKIDNAVKVLLEGMEHSPKNKKLNYAIAEILLENRQFKDALDILNEMPPDDQDVRRLELIGYCMEGMERYNDAEEYADRALSLDPASALTLNLKGILAFRKGGKTTAEDFFKRAIDSDPGYGEPYTNLGTLKWDQEAEEALSLYEKGFILSPTIMDVVTIYHSAVIALGKFEKAEQLFRDANALHPHNKRLKYLLVDILVKQGKHDIAMNEIEEAIIKFGTDDGILSAAIKIRDELGPMKIENSPGNKGSVSLCMIVKNEEQHLAKCLRSVKPVVDEMIVVDTGSTDRTKYIAQAFGAKVFDFEWANDFSEARNYSISKASGAWIFVLDADEVISSIDYDSLRKIVIRSTSKPSAYAFVTKNYTVLTNTVGWVSNDGRYAEEQAGMGWHPSKKVRLFPNDSRIRFENPVHELVEPSLKRSGITFKECSIPVHHYGKLTIDKVVSKGEEYYLLGRSKLEGKADDVQSLTELAIQALELGKYEEALELWQRVIEIKPDNIKALLNIGGIYLQLGRYEDALRASRKAMALGSHLKEVVLNYSSSELFIGDIEKSVSSLENLVRKEPEYPPAIGMLSTAYFILGEKEKGLKYIDKIKKMGFSPGDYLYKRARQFISAGKTDYAILLLEIATESNNANRDVISLLFECYRTYGTVIGNVAIQPKNPEQISSPEIRQ